MLKTGNGATLTSRLVSVFNNERLLFMQHFTGQTSGRVLVIRLDQGDYLLESITSACEEAGLVNGVIVSAIGTLDMCTMHMVMTTGYPPVEHFEVWDDKPLEVSAICGIIADGVPHLHMVVSDHQYAYSGHVEPGCRVLYLAEIVIQEFADLTFIRRANSKGINELHLK